MVPRASAVADDGSMINPYHARGDAGEDLPRNRAGLRRDFIDAEVRAEHFHLVALGHVAAGAVDHELVHRHAAQHRKALPADEGLRAMARNRARIPIAVADAYGGDSRWFRRHKCPAIRHAVAGGQETALFLTRGEGLAKLLRLDKMFRLKVLPISLALPWGVNVGDMLGHVPLPAKITVEALEPIPLREIYGDDPDVDRIYDDVIARMQACLDGLQAERTFPVLG